MTKKTAKPDMPTQAEKLSDAMGAISRQLQFDLEQAAARYKAECAAAREVATAAFNKLV